MRINRLKQRGFTLIEMAIVMVIIGLILGAVSIGKDLQRNAEFKKVKQKFVDQWGQAYNEFYNKYGVVLGDSEVEPTLVVNGNGATHTALVAAGTANYNTIAPLPLRICQGVSNDTDTIDPRAEDPNPTLLHNLFDQAGIRMPPGRAEGREDRYVYLDTNGNPQEVQVCFQWNPPNTFSNAGNVMVIIGLTPDLARMLDEMIDGKPDAREGMFRQQGVANGVGGIAGVPWDRDNTFEFTGDTADNLDEDQVRVVTAHYKMNQ